MPLPPLSSLQFLVLRAILGHERSGREVRERLTQEGEAKSLPSFYQLMARLEDAKFVKGSYRSVDIDGQKFKERWYKITADGCRAYNTTSEFFNNAGAPERIGGQAHVV